MSAVYFGSFGGEFYAAVLHADGQIGDLTPIPYAGASCLLRTSPVRLIAARESEHTRGRLAVFDVGEPLCPRLLREIDPAHHGACHLAADGAWLYGASYFSGCIDAYALEDGVPGAAFGAYAFGATGPGDAQGVPRAHGVLPLADGGVLAADYSGDRVVYLRRDGSEWQEVSYLPLPAGGGVRHLAAGSGGLIYVITERSAVVYVVRWDGFTLRLLSEAAVPGGRFCSALKVAPGGEFLYAGSRGGGGFIAVFRLADGGTHLVPAAALDGLGGVREFAFTPDGRYLLTGDQNAGMVRVFAPNEVRIFTREVSRVAVPGVSAIVF